MCEDVAQCKSMNECFKMKKTSMDLPCSGSREQWTLCNDNVNWNTVHARSTLLMSRFSESGVLTKKEMQNMQSGGGARTGIENRWCTERRAVGREHSPEELQC